MSQTVVSDERPVIPPGGEEFYRVYDDAEDTRRAAYHYDQDPEFYVTHTGGEWNVYSCLVWEPGFTLTQAQEKKLDMLAEVMVLKAGMHVLDVGCGWGGPLVYLCRKYGVSGHGIAVSGQQIETARARAAQYGVNATFELMHWANLPEAEQYDAVYSDEVITHFTDLKGFFAKCHTLLKPGGLMAHKELHLSHSRHSELGPLSRHVIKTFNYTGNYYTLHQELLWLDETDFELTHVIEIPLRNYHQSIDAWLSNLFAERERLKCITSPEFYNDFRAYLKGVRYVFTHTDLMQLHIIGSRKLDAVKPAGVS